MASWFSYLDRNLEKALGFSAVGCFYLRVRERCEMLDVGLVDLRSFAFTLFEAVFLVAVAATRFWVLEGAAVFLGLISWAWV